MCCCSYFFVTVQVPGPQAEGERVLDHHKAQLVRCHMPESRIKSIVVHCSDGESTGHAVVKAIKDQSCDAVCIGTRGLGALQGSGIRVRRSKSAHE